MLTAAIVILAIWLLGIIFDVGGLINLLLIVGLIMLIAHMVRRREHHNV